MKFIKLKKMGVLNSFFFLIIFPRAQRETAGCAVVRVAIIKFHTLPILKTDENYNNDLKRLKICG